MNNITIIKLQCSIYNNNVAVKVFAQNTSIVGSRSKL